MFGKVNFSWGGDGQGDRMPHGADYAADPLAPGLVCDIQYDPELRVFRRSCEEAPNV